MRARVCAYECMNAPSRPARGVVRRGRATGTRCIERICARARAANSCPRRARAAAASRGMLCCASVQRALLRGYREHGALRSTYLYPFPRLRYAIAARHAGFALVYLPSMAARSTKGGIADVMDMRREKILLRFYGADQQLFLCDAPRVEIIQSCQKLYAY